VESGGNGSPTLERRSVKKDGIDNVVRFGVPELRSMLSGCMLGIGPGILCLENAPFIFPPTL